MPLSRLENFLINTDGNILYVNPSDLDATDSFDNRGNSLTRPFVTIQRALIEAARFSYQSGQNNDKFDRTTILLYPGEHVIDNRPGLYVKNNGGSVQYFDVNESDVTGTTDIECFNDWVKELRENNYLHNHTRSGFASIWIFTLNLPWQKGAELFMKHLFDGDAASNTLSWRWVAGLQTKGKHYVAQSWNISKFTNNKYKNIKLNEKDVVIGIWGIGESDEVYEVIVGDSMDLSDVDLSGLSKDQALDIFTCVECGRCTDVCPANRGGGILDPKYHFILDLKDPMLENGDVNVVDKINVEAGWECTTCQACTEVCPVGNHVEKADEIRSFQVLAEGDVPQEYQKLLRNLQETGNTEGSSSSELLNELPVYTADKELVLWLGCFAKHAMDPNFVSSVRNFVKILESAGVTYGVLSNEQCSGDPANKLGDKLTYQLLMDQNVEELNKVKNVTTMCPHCVVNLQKEYKKYHEIKYEVKHHTQVISELLEEGRININPGSLEKVTYHDPCNLSRTLDEVSAPRNAIKAAAPEFFELDESGKETLCCGAGGALWWKKDSGEGRTHLLRAEQVIESKTDTVVTGCNFCYGMMNQGIGPLTPAGQEEIKVKDVADIVAENLS